MSHFNAVLAQRMRVHRSFGVVGFLAFLVLLFGLPVAHAETQRADSQWDFLSDETDEYVINDVVYFYDEFINELFILSDGSMWFISGVYDSEPTIGRGGRNIAIYAGTEDLLPHPPPNSVPGANYGARLDYFMLINGDPRTYFVYPLPPQKFFDKYTVYFYNQSLNHVFMTSDGLMWMIKGASRCGDEDNTGHGAKNVNIYSGTKSLPDTHNNPLLRCGTKKDSYYFMLIDGDPKTYFIELITQPLTISINNATLGTVKSNPQDDDCRIDPCTIDCSTGSCTKRFPSGMDLTLDAIPAKDAMFAGWSGSCTGMGSCTVNMNSKRKVNANFKEAAYSLSVNKIGAGNVLSASAGINCGSDCTKEYRSGTKVTLTAQAGANYRFERWSGACVGTGTCSVTMNANKNVTATFTRLAAPVGLKATAVSPKQIDLTWQDKSNDETEFRIERKVGMNGTWAQIARVGANITSYSSKGLTPGEMYFYRVRAENETSQSVYSGGAKAITPLVSPIKLTATAISSTQVSLTWQDRSDNETSFRIERKTGANGAWAQIASVKANATIYSNTTVKAKTAYTYRVRAANAVGLSAYSNVFSVTTP